MLVLTLLDELFMLKQNIPIAKYLIYAVETAYCGHGDLNGSEGFEQSHAYIKAVLNLFIVIK